MKLAAVLLITFACAVAIASEPGQPPTPPDVSGPAVETPARQTLNNDAIISMTEKGLADDEILTKIQAAPAVDFSVDTDDLVKLKDAGVKSPVIAEMITRAADKSNPYTKEGSIEVVRPNTWTTTRVSGSRVIPPRLEDGRYGYVEVVTVDGVPGPELYARAKAWAATAYRSAQSVIQLDDSTNGKLVLKGNFASTAHGDDGTAFLGHTLVIESKPGRYRYTLTGFTVQSGRANEPMEGFSDLVLSRQLFEIVATDVPGLIDSLKAAMLKPTPATDSNW